MAHILGERAKDLAQEADREREAQETAVKTAKEKMKVAETAEKLQRRTKHWWRKGLRRSWPSKTKQM